MTRKPRSDTGSQDTRPGSEPPLDLPEPIPSRRLDSSRARPIEERRFSWRSPLARGETIPHRYTFDEHPTAPPSLIMRVWLRWQHWFYVAGCLLVIAVLGPVAWLVWNVTHDSPDSPALIAITATPEPTPSPAPSLTPVPNTWPTDLTYEERTVPARIRHTLDAPGVRQGYQFNGTAGQTWRLAVGPYQGSGIQPLAQVYAPSGADLTPNGQPAALVEWTLAESGAYHVVVAAPADLLPGGGYYLLTLEVVR